MPRFLERDCVNEGYASFCTWKSLQKMNFGLTPDHEISIPFHVVAPASVEQHKGPRSPEAHQTPILYQPAQPSSNLNRAGDFGNAL